MVSLRPSFKSPILVPKIALRPLDSGHAPRLVVRQAGDGEPLVLLHGLASSSRYWEPHFPVLTARYRAIAPDLLGFGASPKPFDNEYSVANHLAALIAAIEDSIDRPVTLVGHSMGSILALHLAAARPDLVARLILISLPAVGACAFGHSPDGGPGRVHALMVHTTNGRRLATGGSYAVRLVGTGVYPYIRRDLPKNAARDSLKAGWTAYWRTLEEVVYGSDVPALVRAARGPLTMVHGARDIVVPVGPVREVAASREDITYIERPEAGHNPCHSHPAVFYDLLGTPGPAVSGPPPHSSPFDTVVYPAFRAAKQVQDATRQHLQRRPVGINRRLFARGADGQLRPRFRNHRD